MRRAIRSERGEIAPTLLVFPAIIAAFYVAIHASLIYRGQTVVGAAAQDGLWATQLAGGTVADGEAQAQQVVGLAPGLRDVTIEVEENGDLITVRVSGVVETLLLGFFTDVEAEVTGQRERFFTEPERNGP